MLYTTFCIISAIILILFIIFSLILFLIPYKRKRLFLKPFHFLISGIFLSAVFLFYPLYVPQFIDNSVPVLTTILASLHNTIRLFVVDCDFSFIVEETKDLIPALRSSYTVLYAILLFTAPIMTAGAVLFFFQNISAHTKFFFKFFNDTYVFSELNERSIALGKSIKEADKKRVIVFTDVYRNDEESTYELIDQAKELNAILFKNDITLINFKLHSKKTKLYFFIIGNNEVENTNQAYKLSTKPTPFFKKDIQDKLDLDDTRIYYGYDYRRADTRLYFFSTSFSSEHQLGAINTEYLKIRRVNDVQSLVYMLLHNNGEEIFDTALETNNTVYNPVTKQEDKEKKISAMIIGLGLHGTEMLKALTWFAQMHPYRIEINAFDKRDKMGSLLQSSLPELFDWNPADKTATKPLKNYNDNFTTPGEAHYKISVFSNVDVTLYEFDKRIQEISDTTYVLVALGNDDLNIQVATKIRILFERMGKHPTIHTIVYNPNKQDMLKRGLTSSYDIRLFGDVSTNYSEACILNSVLEQKAFERHMQYTYKQIEKDNLTGKKKEDAIKKSETQFWSSDYSYRSSIASVIHNKLKKHCGLPGSDKSSADRTLEEKIFYQTVEHQRWNAYVRSEGYVYGPIKNYLAKTHSLLVPYDELPPSEQIKDED